MRRKWIFIAPLAILAMLAFVAVGGAAVMLLWNWLLPSLFGWHAIGFWQALGILALSRILFGGLGHGFFRPGLGRHMGDRWAHMTPEERERFRQGLRSRCGFGPTPSEGQGQ